MYLPMTIKHKQVTYTLIQLYAEQGYIEDAEKFLEILECQSHAPEKSARIRHIIKEQKKARLKSLMAEWVACIRKEGSV